MATVKVADIEYLRNALAYDADLGSLTWRHRQDMRPQWNARYAGKAAFTAKNQWGYPCGRIGDIGFLAHRVAWAIHYGEWPDEIDHINGVRGDYSIKNLRNVSRAENMKNIALSRANTSGTVGVTWYRNYSKWAAQIVVVGKNVKLGYYDNKDDAVAARKDAEAKYGFHPNHGRNTGTPCGLDHENGD